jgi:hypothetical protein
VSELDAELKRLERRSARLFRRAIAGDVAAAEAFLENTDRLILLLATPAPDRPLQ